MGEVGDAEFHEDKAHLWARNFVEPSLNFGVVDTPRDVMLVVTDGVFIRRLGIGSIIILLGRRVWLADVVHDHPVGVLKAKGYLPVVPSFRLS